MEKVKVVLYKISQIFVVIFVVIFVASLFETNDLYMHPIRRYAKLALSAMWGVPMILAVVIILIKNYDNSKIPKEKDKDALTIIMKVALAILALIFIFFLFYFGVIIMAGRN